MFTYSKKSHLIDEIARLEQELFELSNNLSESQVAYKRARLQYLKQQLADIDKNKFKDASDKLKQDMTNKDMMAALSANNGRNN